MLFTHKHGNLLKICLRQRHYWKNMDCSLLNPPLTVRGMLDLQREAFNKRVQIPRLRIREEQASHVLPLVKKLLLKMEQLRPVRTLPQRDNETHIYKEVLLHPLPVKAWTSLPTKALQELDVDATQFYFDDVELSYANWRADEIFKSVLPADEENLTSYSRIGHIVHLNLREHLLSYKRIIGDVLRDKVPGCRTVVNKTSNIDNTFRNFELELVCGDPVYQVETKENGVIFEFDFSRVYWNPRLSTEHERIVQMLNAGDVLYDVFAGVGPFSVPSARKRCAVLANDLNPESFRWLQHNVKRNKCAQHMHVFNKDGRDFILQDLKADLLRRLTQQTLENAPNYSIHITMNLPAIAVEFLDAFRGLFQKEAVDLKFKMPHFNYPIVHVYAFAKGEHTEVLVRTLVEQHLGFPLADNLRGIHFVRNVAPNKDMYRVSFSLTEAILTTPMVAITKLKGETLRVRKRAAENDVTDAEETQQMKVKCI